MTRNPNKWLSLALFSLALWSPAQAQDADARLARQLGLTQVTLRHQGRQRVFYYHGRVNPRSARLKPVLLVLHGGGGSALDTAGKSGYDALADRDGFLTIYPEGVNGNWNDGRGTVSMTGVDVTMIDDVGFLRKVLDHATANLKGDPQRCYSTGVSNGGLMSYRLGIELSDRIAAIAAVAANLPLPLATARPGAPMPTLVMNGTADPIMLWDGIPAGPDGGGTLSAQATVRYWIEANRGRGVVRASVEHLPDLDRRDRSTVDVTTYSGLRAPVVLYTVQGGGHNIPRTDPEMTVPERLVGPQNRDIEGPEEIWAFLSQFQRD